MNNIIISKTHGIPRMFKGFWKVCQWRSFVEGWAKFGQHAAHSLGKTVLHTCSDLFKPVQSSSHLFTPVQTCSNLLTPVHNCSHLFTPQWLSTLFAQFQFHVELPPWQSCYFSILHPILLKLHILAGLIESFSTVYSLCSCNEIKMSIPLGAHA